MPTILEKFSQGIVPKNLRGLRGAVPKNAKIRVRWIDENTSYWCDLEEELFKSLKDDVPVKIYEVDFNKKILRKNLTLLGSVDKYYSDLEKNAFKNISKGTKCEQKGSRGKKEKVGC